MLIREQPATEVTLATRILAHAGALAPAGRVALVVGSEVVYLAGRQTAPTVMSPYDVVALRLRDGVCLVGEPPDDVEDYLGALRTEPRTRCVARSADGSLVSANDLPALVREMVGLDWVEAEARARSAGALIGAYPAEES